MISQAWKSLDPYGADVEILIDIFQKLPGSKGWTREHRYQTARGVWMRYTLGWTYVQIAKELQRSSPGVREKINFAICRLADYNLQKGELGHKLQEDSRLLQAVHHEENRIVLRRAARRSA